MEIKETSLINLHKSYGAKLVEFAGYHMPIQYSEGILSEHKFTRSNCGIFDVSHMGQLFIYGDDNLTKDLEKIFPIDLQSLKINQSKYSFLMNEKGGICDDLIITKIKKGYMIILNAACKANDFKILKEKLDISYEIELKEDLSLIALQGPGAKNILGKVIPEITNLRFMHGGEFIYNDLKIYITRSGYTGEDGFEISISNEIAEHFTKVLLEHGSKLIGLGARDTLRLEAGLCLYGNDLDTEKQIDNSSSIDKLTSIQILKLINSEDSSITKKIAEALEDIDSVVEICIQSIRSGGRIFYIGAGTSGRLGVLDASEIPHTFSAH